MNIGLIIIAVVSLVFSIYCLWQISELKKRFRLALGSQDGKDLEHILASYLKRVDQVSQHHQELDEAYRNLAASLSLASQKLSIVRFNPFGDTGGDQSFVLAVLDSHNSGYVLTSIHGREGTRVYVKPIDYGKSKYTLSAEELQALNQASKRIPKQHKDK